MNKSPILALASLIGTIVGAGIFAIPYVMARAGVLLMVCYFFVLGLIVIFIYLAFGEMILRTREKHRLVGYAEKYLGNGAKILVTFSIVVGGIGALLAYIILGGKFLELIFGGLNSFQFSLILWAVLFFFVYLGIKSIAPLEVFLNAALLGVFVLIFGFSLPKIQQSSFILLDKSYLFMPFGVVLFSLLGWDAIPEIEGIFKRRENLKKVIMIALPLSVFLYLFFAFTIVGVSGSATTQEPFAGLLGVLGNKIIILGGLFGLLSVSTSILIGANYIKNTLFYDYGMRYKLAFTITAFSPMALFLLGARQFIAVVAFVGTAVGVIEGTVIALSWGKAKIKGDRKPEYKITFHNSLVYLLILTLVLGAVSQLFYYL